MTAHTCREDANPRHKGYCCKCGRALPHTTSGNPTSGKTLSAASRDLSMERALTKTAGEQAGLASVAQELGDFAEQRAGDGPLRDFLQRDLATDAFEEAADWRNYVTWRFLQRLALGAYTAESAQHYLNALAAMVTAFHELKLAEDA